MMIELDYTFRVDNKHFMYLAIISTVLSKQVIFYLKCIKDSIWSYMHLHSKNF